MACNNIDFIYFQTSMNVPTFKEAAKWAATTLTDHLYARVRASFDLHLMAQIVMVGAFYL
jgi:hypothetical protein